MLRGINQLVDASDAVRATLMEEVVDAAAIRWFTSPDLHSPVLTQAR